MTRKCAEGRKYFHIILLVKMYKKADVYSRTRFGSIFYIPRSFAICFPNQHYWFCRIRLFIHDKNPLRTKNDEQSWVNIWPFWLRAQSCTSIIPLWWWWSARNSIRMTPVISTFGGCRKHWFVTQLRTVKHSNGYPITVSRRFGTHQLLFELLEANSVEVHYKFTRSI